MSGFLTKTLYPPHLTIRVPSHQFTLVSVFLITFSVLKKFKMNISPDFCCFLERSSKPRIQKNETKINSKVKNVQPHILFKNSMTHKKYFSKNFYLQMECRKQTSNCGHNSIFAKTQEKNMWTELVKTVAKLSTELPLHLDNRINEGTQSVHMILCLMQSPMLHNWQRIRLL